MPPRQRSYLLSVVCGLTLALGGPEISAYAAEPPRPLLDLGSRPVTIVCLGDSVTGVYYHTGGRRAYPEMLEIALRKAVPKAQVKVINAGISGHTTVDGLARLDRDVLQHRPDLVTISFGLNDMSRLSEEAYGTNLAALVTRCRDAQARVVLCTPNSVITTDSRPVEKLGRYCEVLRALAKLMDVPVCDQFAAGEALRAKDAWAWRLTFSDAIHPNMDGHKRMAEQLCRTISGHEVSLADVAPPTDFLRTTRKRLAEGQPIKVLAMAPLDKVIPAAIRQLQADAKVDVQVWPVDGKSVRDLEATAKGLVRTMKPDLVVLAVPATAATSTDESFVEAYSWIMNWSLSFGQQEWDCIVVHPSVVTPNVPEPLASLTRRLVAAQHLMLVDRGADDHSSIEQLVVKSLQKAAQ